MFCSVNCYYSLYIQAIIATRSFIIYEGNEMSKDNSQDQSQEIKSEDFNTPYEEPKLTFIEPKLTKQGDATKITKQGGFFGSFTPR